MRRVGCGFGLVVSFVALLGTGCGSPPPTALTPEQIQKQRAEDKVDLKAEDQAEAEFQKKRKR